MSHLDEPELSPFSFTLVLGLLSIGRKMDNIKLDNDQFFPIIHVFMINVYIGFMTLCHLYVFEVENYCPDVDEQRLE